MQLSIAISTDTTQRGLSGCLDSLADQSFAGLSEITTYQWQHFPDRPQILAKAKFDAVLLLDGDCALPHRQFFNVLFKLAALRPEAAVFGGGYRDFPTNTYWDRAYNGLCNSWVEHGLNQNGQPANLLGGCLFVMKSRLPANFTFPKADFWGGEDTVLLRKLAQSNVPMVYSPKISVLHQPGNNFTKTLRRGFLHGLNRNRLSLKTPQNRRPKSLPPVKQWPWWALHFSAMELGSVWHDLGKLSRPESKPRP